MDIAVPGDSNILQKETEKCEKYQDLAREIQRIWKSRTKVVPVVLGVLGSVSKKLAGYLEQLGIKNRTRTMQKSALLGSAHILRKGAGSLNRRANILDKAFEFEFGSKFRCFESFYGAPNLNPAKAVR